MTKELVNFYRPTLYASLAVLLALNVVSLMAGRLMALLPFSLQCAVLASVYLRKFWAVSIVKAWGLILMMIGIFMWIAVLLDGPSHFGSLLEGVFNTLVMVMGLYFFYYARMALSHNEAIKGGVGN